MACGWCCGARLLSSGARCGCAAALLAACAVTLRLRRHACCGIVSVGGRFNAGHPGTFAWCYAGHALACSRGRALVPGCGAALRAARRFGLTRMAACSGYARMGDVVVGCSCVCGVRVRCAAMFLTCGFVLHAIAHERSRGVVLTIKLAFALQLVARAGHRGAGCG